jgi:hypothetical protein
MFMAMNVYTKKSEPGVVAHACIPSYLGSEDLEDHNSMPSKAKSQQGSMLINKPGMVVYACNLSH